MIVLSKWHVRLVERDAAEVRKNRMIGDKFVMVSGASRGVSNHEQKVELMLSPELEESG